MGGSTGMNRKMKHIIFLALILVSSITFASDVTVEIFTPTIEFKNGSAERIFIHEHTITLDDDNQIEFLKGIAELKPATTNSNPVATNRPWVGKELYLVVIQNNQQVGNIIQIYTKESAGEISVFNSLRIKNGNLTGDFESSYKFRSKPLEELIQSIIKTEKYSSKVPVP